MARMPQVKAGGELSFPMPQDPRTLHVDTVTYPVFTEKPPHVMGNSKRYATYFPSQASIEAELLGDASSDNDSTWEFSAPVSPPSRSSSNTSCTTSGSTPAQDIVIRYRSGISRDTRWSSPSQYSEPDSWEMTPPAAPARLEYVPVTPDQGIKARYRQSRYDALLNTYQEAFDVARAAGLKKTDQVVCNRPGCRDTLANVEALMYHLHIHDIDDRQVVCPRCQGSYDGQRELRMHKCSGRSSRTRPLRETLRRVFIKFSF